MSNENSGKMIRRKTKALSVESRLRHVRAWKRSGLSAPAYAHKHNLKAKNLYVWRSKLKLNSETSRAQKAVVTKSSSTILPVCVEGVPVSCSHLALTFPLCGKSIRLDGFSNEAELLSMLGKLREEVFNV